MQEYIRSIITEYGLLVFVRVLKHFEDIEKYRICRDIKAAITDVCAKNDMEIYTKESPELVEKFFKAHENSPNKGKLAYDNVPTTVLFVVDLIEKEENKFKNS